MAFLTAVVLAISAFGDFGFYKEIEGLDNRDIKSKIFKIYTPAGQYSSLPLANKAILIEGTEDLLAQGQIDPIQYKAIHFQVNYCELQQMDPCLLFLDIIQGTAFTAGDQGTVWTAFHNVTGAAINAVGKFIVEHNTKDYQSVISFMHQSKFPVYLVDEDGDILVEPQVDESNWAENIEFPFDNIAEFFEGGQPSAERDFAKFVIPTLEISPLPISPKVDSSKSIFLGGYPSSTQGKKAQYGALDSDGRGFYFGRGDLLDVDSFYKRQNYQSSITELQRLRRSKQIMTTADGFSGHSGSPFITSEGEVVGIFVEYLPGVNPTPETNTSYGPSFSYIYDILNLYQIL